MVDDMDASRDLAGFVPLVFAHDNTEAESYRSLLEDHDIAVQFRDEEDEPPSSAIPVSGLAILVPHEMATEAEEIIERRSEIHEELIEEFDHDHDDDDGDDDDEYADFEELDLETGNLNLYNNDDEDY